MTTTDGRNEGSPDVGTRLRRDLVAVANALDVEHFPASSRPVAVTEQEAKQPHSKRRRLALGAGALAVPLALAAGAYVQDGPEYVDTIATERIVETGSVDGSRYLLVESDRTDACGNPVTGVELVQENKNLLGSEWNTSGYQYGEPVERACGSVNDASRYLKDPSLFTDSGVEVGDSFVWVYAVHPDVDTVRITSGDYTKNLPVYEVDGAGYAPFEVPKKMDSYTSELFIDGQPVPGSVEEQQVVRP